MGDITTHLLELQKAITENMRYEVSRAERVITERINELKEKQDIQNGRVNRHETLLATYAGDQRDQDGRIDHITRDQEHFRVLIAKLDERTKGSLRGFLNSLSVRQKAALTTIATAFMGALAERGWQFGKWLVAALARGGQP
jgi:hypothetical protein